MTRRDAKIFIHQLWRETIRGSYGEEALEIAIEALEQPERKRGKWLRYGEDGNPNEDDTVFWQCDQCLETYTGRTTRIPNFCPNCGADMRKPMTIPEDIINSVLGYDD